ncbi:hypothetical protein X474_17385 [Dethiosulfatarculus sandiegensis]|uniref:Uncharacterized protein n=1 Tax=Dethiosulfatarculus sandiegensis TaxID=1429043 RepID=A0A0D2JAU6_9BACT|nr:hypothetical protein X474_17385 [Dethiosulfatarculus sandiegensis]
MDVEKAAPGFFNALLLSHVSLGWVLKETWDIKYK